MARAHGAAMLLVSGVLIGVALSCSASSLVMSACASTASKKSRSRRGLVCGSRHHAPVQIGKQ